jgi:hypothetical protein
MLMPLTERMRPILGRRLALAAERAIDRVLRRVIVPRAAPAAPPAAGG